MSPSSDMKTNPTDDLIWRALADPVRREILDLLSTNPRTTGELVAHFDSLCRTGVMKHLDVLVAADLVIVAKSGRTRWNHLNPVPIERVCQRWVDGHVKRISRSALRLKATVEQDAMVMNQPVKPKQTRRKCNDKRSEMV